MCVFGCVRVDVGQGLRGDLALWPEGRLPSRTGTGDCGAGASSPSAPYTDLAARFGIVVLGCLCLGSVCIVRSEACTKLSGWIETR